jgi:hypothetical protein
MLALAVSMKKTYLGISILLILTYCKDKPKEAAVPNIECQPYFQFDRLMHYRISISDDSVGILQGQINRDEKVEKLFGVLSDRVFDEKYSMTSLSDTIKLMDLEELGFIGKETPNDKISAIDKLFCDRDYDESDHNMCLPVYRDIIFFKRKHRTVGFARICFDCNMSNIVGSNRETSTFGQGGEYESLSLLLQ